MTARHAHPSQLALPGPASAPGAPAPTWTWHATHEVEALPAASGLPARGRCRACGLSSVKRWTARLGPLPCPGDPWGAPEELRARAPFTEATHVLVRRVSDDGEPGCWVTQTTPAPEPEAYAAALVQARAREAVAEMLAEGDALVPLWPEDSRSSTPNRVGEGEEVGAPASAVQP